MTDKSEQWDKKEKSRDSSGFAKRETMEDHKHVFGSVRVNGDESEPICLICRRTREEIRNSW